MQLFDQLFSLALAHARAVACVCHAITVYVDFDHEMSDLLHDIVMMMMITV